MLDAVARLDWSRTPLGPLAGWPASLSAAVSICLHSHFPMLVLWGPEMVLLYNDAYVPVLGDKHPDALGRPIGEVWDEIWPTIGPMLHGVMSSGVATRGDDLLLSLMRRGFMEECYFTFSYSPIRAEGGSTGGVFIAVLETTARVVNERRLKALSALGARLPLARDQSHALQLVGEVLASNLHSFPLAALYLADAERRELVPALCTGLSGGTPEPLAPLCLDEDAHPVATVLRTGCPAVVRFDAVAPAGCRCGVWPEPPRQALVLPLQLPGQPLPCGVLLLAADARQPLDAEYRAFFDLVAGQVVAAMANTRAMEAERRRAQALAELDRAKSEFFSNVSHELRTPVTLVLGPLEELLTPGGPRLPARARAQLDVAQRNAQRLKKLVDAVLDIARIESGRLLARPVPTDVAALTRETASLFRCAAEARGLRLGVKADPRLPLLALDRDMWERVVVNLLSNAIKCTREGGVELELGRAQDTLVLVVRDTGCGIDADELPHICERFYRTRTAVRMAIEGTGLGLALVQQLLQLNGGDLDVESSPGIGSTFRVSLPMLPVCGEAPASAGERAAELGRPAAMGLVADLQRGTTPPRARNLPAPAPAGGRDLKVLVVDDNRDLTDYIARLLGEHCEVIAVHDGGQALTAARAWGPDMLLADVMMPGLDGFALLRAIRADATTHTMSVLLLSARAGEEARVEALEAGADDYFVKPFNARELRARVRSLVQLVRLRREAVEREAALLRQIAVVEQDLEGMLDATQDAVASFDQQLRCRFANAAAAELVGANRSMLVGRGVAELSPETVGSPLEHALRRAAETRKTATVEHFHNASRRWFNVRCYPTAQGVLMVGSDITEQRRVQDGLRLAHADLERSVAERTGELRAAHELLAATFDRAPGGIAVLDLSGHYLRTNAALQRLLGRSEAELSGLSMEAVTWPADCRRKQALMAQLLHGERESFAMELRYARPDGTLLWVSNFVSTINKGGRAQYFVSISQDISDRRKAEAEMAGSQRELRQLYDRLQSVREEERLALAREVHDQLGQLLSAAKIDIKLLEDDLRASSAPPSRRKLLAELRSARQTMDRAIESVREVAMRLRPPELDEHGLCAAIGWHARDFERRTRMRFAVRVAPGLREPGGAVATALFRIYQEAVTNVLRHARASRVEVSLAMRGQAVLLRVRDDGVGLSRQQARSSRSLGITGMRERAAVCCGRLRVVGLPSGGTLVSVRMPLDGASLALPQQASTDP